MFYGYQTWSEESLMQVYDDDDLHWGQRSSEVKCDKLCAMVTKRGQKNPLCKFKMMMTFMEVKGHQRSNGGKLCAMATIMVKRITDASLKWWLPSWRSKVTYSKLCSMATKLDQTISYDNDDLHRGQRATEVKCVNLLYGYHIWSDIPLI